MPLTSAQVFLSSLRQVGKTSLALAAAADFAKRHPSRSVCILDLTENGHATKYALGGIYDGDGDAGTQVSPGTLATVHRLIQDCSGNVPELEESGLEAGPRTPGRHRALRLGDYVVQLHKCNKNVPDNLYLISSNAYPRKLEELPKDERKAIGAQIRALFQQSKDDWALVCDVDGETRPSSWTLLGCELCPLAVVPLRLGQAVLDDFETYLGVLAYLRREDGEAIPTQVGTVVFNMVKAVRNETVAAGPLELTFRPSRPSRELLERCAARLEALAHRPELAGVFAHAGADGKGAFLRRTVAVARLLGEGSTRPLERGVPFAGVLQVTEAENGEPLLVRSPEGKRVPPRWRKMPRPGPYNRKQ